MTRLKVSGRQKATITDLNVIYHQTYTAHLDFFFVSQALQDMDILITSGTRLLKTLCKLMEARLEESPGAANAKSCQALVACIASLQNMPQPFSRKSDM